LPRGSVSGGDGAGRKRTREGWREDLNKNWREWGAKKLGRTSTSAGPLSFLLASSDAEDLAGSLAGVIFLSFALPERPFLPEAARPEEHTATPLRPPPLSTEPEQGTRQVKKSRVEE
jgi:hypothetical protein